MQRLTGIMLAVAIGTAVLSGCALRDPRYDAAYDRASNGLWNSSYELIDWNFPTSVNQGPIEAPKRIRLEPTAIGVTWATRNPLPLKDESPAQDAPAVTSSDDVAPVTAASSSARPGVASAPRERGGPR